MVDIQGIQNNRLCKYHNFFLLLLMIYIDIERLKSHSSGRHFPQDYIGSLKSSLESVNPKENCTRKTQTFKWRGNCWLDGSLFHLLRHWFLIASRKKVSAQYWHWSPNVLSKHFRHSPEVASHAPSSFTLMWPLQLHGVQASVNSKPK